MMDLALPLICQFLNAANRELSDMTTDVVELLVVEINSHQCWSKIIFAI